jgi:unsaturated chondroitin disaccharide hydrolase
MDSMRTLSFIILFLATIFIACKNEVKETPIEEVVIEALDFSVQQSLKMAESLKDKEGVLPKTTDRFGKLETCDPAWWVSGFYPGVLWYLYEYTNNEKLKDWAQFYSKRVESQQYTTGNHDVGFMIFCSFGNGYRLTNDTSYLSVIHNAARSLSTRFRKSIGCIRSWDYAEWNKQWQYPVIIDNMMNLELLLWTTDKFSDSTFKKIATTHANTTMKNHYRDDYSCYHVISYDTITGDVEHKHTAQGFSHESSWARGQAWGLYGYTMMYRFTKDTSYLKHAENIASFIINHPRLPADKIPYWDFDAPNIPDCYRDASAGAIICSALIELSQLTNNHAKAKEYLTVAEKQIRTLSTPQYRNALGNNGNFILKHSVGHLPANSEVDVPLSYADYYYVEALMRYKRIKGL